MDEKDVGVAGAVILGAMVFYLLLVVGGALIQGWVGSVLWNWFVVTLFHAPTISVGYGAGIMLLVTFVKSGVDMKKDERETDWGKVCSVLMTPFVLLFVGWLIHLIAG